MTVNDTALEAPRPRAETPPRPAGAARQPKASTLRSFRLTPLGDERLRQNTEARRGAIKAQLLPALTEQDLMDVPLDEPENAASERKLTTTASISDEIYARVVRAAADRGVSVARLVNCAIIHFYQPAKG